MHDRKISEVSKLSPERVEVHGVKDNGICKHMLSYSVGLLSTSCSHSCLSLAAAGARIHRSRCIVYGPSEMVVLGRREYISRKVLFQR